MCRDFAHIGAAFCRALGIPARFVSCYAHGLVPSDFHAVFEAYLDGRWWLFDATRQADLDGLVRIGVGRDAAEIAFQFSRNMIGGIAPGEVREGADAKRLTEAVAAAMRANAPEAGGAEPADS